MRNEFIGAFISERFHYLFAFLCALFVCCAIYNLVRGLIQYRSQEPDSSASNEGRLHLRRVKKYVFFTVLSFILFNFIPSQSFWIKLNLLPSYSYYSSYGSGEKPSYSEMLEQELIRLARERHYKPRARWSLDEKYEPPSERELTLAREYESFKRSSVQDRQDATRLQSMILLGVSDSPKNNVPHK